MPERFTPSAQEIHTMELNWARAEQALDILLGGVKHDIPIVANATGLSDASITFDYLYTFIVSRVQRGDSVQSIFLLAAAAMTKLARASRADTELLTRLDEEMNDDNH